MRRGCGRLRHHGTRSRVALVRRVGVLSHGVRGRPSTRLRSLGLVRLLLLLLLGLLLLLLVIVVGPVVVTSAVGVGVGVGRVRCTRCPRSVRVAPVKRLLHRRDRGLERRQGLRERRA